jgi:hypothetical protein
MRAAARACADWGAFGHGLPVGNFGDDPAVGRLGR